MKTLIALALLAMVAYASAATYTQQYACGQYRRSYRCGSWWSRRTCYSYTTRYCTRICVDGGFSDWSPETVGPCSVSCGGGHLFRSKARTCTNPAPEGCGSDCTGNNNSIVEEMCNTHPCPLDGGWGNWTEWQDMDDCPVLCGGGLVSQNRSRVCDNPEPKFGGRDCLGDRVQQRDNQPCNTDACGERCPEGQNTYIDAEDDDHRFFFQCVQGHGDITTKAVLKKCQKKTHWNQTLTACVKSEVAPQAAPTHAPTAAPVATCVVGTYRATPGSRCASGDQCTHGGWSTLPTCADGMKFDAAISNCNWEASVTCAEE